MEDCYVECLNDECGWKGVISECVYEIDEFLCPLCNEPVEPDQVY